MGRPQRRPCRWQCEPAQCRVRMIVPERAARNAPVVDTERDRDVILVRYGRGKAATAAEEVVHLYVRALSLTGHIDVGTFKKVCTDLPRFSCGGRARACFIHPSMGFESTAPSNPFFDFSLLVFFLFSLSPQDSQVTSRSVLVFYKCISHLTFR